MKESINTVAEHLAIKIRDEALNKMRAGLIETTASQLALAEEFWESVGKASISAFGEEISLLGAAITLNSLTRTGRNKDG